MLIVVVSICILCGLLLGNGVLVCRLICVLVLVRCCSGCFNWIDVYVVRGVSRIVLFSRVSIIWWC